MVINELTQHIGSHSNAFAKHAIIDASEDSAFVEMLFTRIQQEYVEPLALQELSLDYLIKLLALWVARRTTADSRSDHQPSRAGLHFKHFRKLVDENHKSQWPIS